MSTQFGGDTPPSTVQGAGGGGGEGGDFRVEGVRLPVHRWIGPRWAAGLGGGRRMKLFIPGRRGGGFAGGRTVPLRPPLDAESEFVLSG